MGDKPNRVESDDEVKVKTRGPLNIIYGTTGGNSARLASNLLSEAKENHYQAKLLHLGDFEPTQYTNLTRAVFIISTYGSGGPTLDADAFYNWFQPLNDPSLFSNLKYTVFGLGNSTFEDFAGFGVKVNSKLEALGAKQMFPFGKGNAAEDTTDKDFEVWKTDFWVKLNEQFELQEVTMEEIRKSEAGFQLTVLKNGEEVDLNSYQLDNSKIEGKLKDYFNASALSINSISELRQNPQESSCLHIDLNLEGSSLKYDTAGNLGVFPENEEGIVEKFANQQGYNLNELFDLTSTKVKLPVPTPLKVKTFLVKFCDLLGPVNKPILQNLAAVGGNQQFSSLVEEWVRKNEKFEKEIVEVNHSIFSLCLTFKLKIPLLNLIQLSNRIFPRFYTISSSSKMNPNSLQLCVSLLKIEDPLDKRFGQTSSFFGSLVKTFKNTKVRVFHQPSLFKLPTDSQHPLIMIGPGAGVAPFRAFLQEKQVVPQSIGESHLYFGCRGKNVDFLYQDELESFQKKGICNKLRVAFSRDGPNKVYVQDLMEEDIDQIAELVFNQNAVIYVCGSKAVGEAVKDYIKSLYTKKKGMAPYSAYSKVSQLESSKRLIMEVWG